jgi:lysozyme
MSAVAEIAESEGLELVAYLCPAGVWTIGWGETDGVRPGDKCTKEEADRWLCEDLTERTRAVLDLCKVETSPNELGAMVSLSYNIGLGGFSKSTVLKAHNAGDKQSASRAFGLWNKARNPRTKQLEELPGLTARRAREAALYLKPEPGQRVEAMPQAIEAESPPMASPINKSGVAAASVGVVSLIAEAGESLGGLTSPLAKVRNLFTDVLGIPGDWILPIMLVGLGVAVMYWRYKQRKTGWA